MNTLETRLSKTQRQHIADHEVPMAGQLGLRVERVASGEVTLRVPYQASFVRPGGTIAGPVMMAAADFAV